MTDRTTDTIDRATIAKVYFGKPGCGCGCRGNYYVDARNITRVVNRMNRSGDTIKVYEDDDGGTIYAVDGDRYMWAYNYARPDDAREWLN